MREKIREVLDEIYRESETLPERFGDAVVAELAARFSEDRYEISRKTVVEEMLWCYMSRMQ